MKIILTLLIDLAGIVCMPFVWLSENLWPRKS